MDVQPPERKKQERACACGSKEDLHLYAGGWKCPRCVEHQRGNAARPGEGRYCAPTRCYCGECPSYGQHFVCLDFKGTIIDLRAIASGKRRAPAHEYRAAQAALAGLR